MATIEPSGQAPSPPKRLKIAGLNRNFDPTGGGAERYSIAMVEQLAAQHDIHVFAQSIRHHWPGVTYHTISMPCQRPRWINQLWYAYVSWRATRSGFDVVHSHENTWHGQVQTVHVLPIKYNLLNGRFGLSKALRWFKIVTSPRLLAYLWLEQRRYAPQPGRRLVVISDSLKAVMEKTHPHTHEMMDLITCGVASVLGAATASQKLGARHHLKLQQPGKLILFVANDFEKKGLPTLLKALAQLGEDVNLAVVGNLTQAPAFANQIAQLGLQQRVFFTGPLTDMQPAYQAADCLAHPTLEDTFGMAVLEALSYALPVVVSPVQYCGIAGLLRHRLDALLLSDPIDPTALAQALTLALNNVALRQTLADNAVQFARRHLWSELALVQESLFLRVADFSEK